MCRKLKNTGLRIIWQTCYILQKIHFFEWSNAFLFGPIIIQMYAL